MKIRMICLLLLTCLIITGCNTAAQNSEAKKPSSSSLDALIQNNTELNLQNPSDCMVFLETVLSEIEEERKLKPHSFLDYSDEYTIEYVKNKERKFVLFTVQNGPVTKTYIIADTKTKKYRYFDASNSFELFRFDDSEAIFGCPTGETGLRFPNFPYNITYSFDEKKWDKKHLPINSDHVYYKLGGHPASFGIIDKIVVTDDKAEIIFGFDELLKNEDIDNPLPILHYWFDPIINQATLSFSGVSFTDTALTTHLESVAGIENVKIIKTDAIDLEARASEILTATQITFNISPEYNLYGEYDNVEWYPAEIKNKQILFWLWTEKK